MRISILLLALSLTCLTVLLATPVKSQGAENTDVTLELKGETLASALKKIESLTPFRFVYRNKEIKGADNLTLAAGTRTVSETLEILLADMPLTFRQINNNILIERKADVAEGENAMAALAPVDLQDRPVRGKVTSSEDGSALPGVSVLVKGTQMGTVSDSDGNYTINVPSESSILVFSFIGYTTIETEVGGRSTVDVALTADITELSEVIVTSFGIEQEKQGLGYSVQDVKGEDLANVHQPNVVSALQGQVAGVQITNSGGAPGMSSRIVIRGINSLNPDADNQPLFVVDGIPIDNNTFEVGPGVSGENTPRGLSNRAADINPNDIESVTVLKGGAASALYGVRAANGAVVITTKKGKAGRVQINASTTYGFDRINKYPKFQDEYGQGSFGNYLPNDIFPSWGAPIAAGSLIDPEYRYYDNVKNAMQTGKMWDNYISVSGGNDLATFYASVSNTDQEGVIPFSTWGRTVAKLNASLKFSEKFSVSASMNYSNSGGSRVPHDRFMENLMYYPVTRDVRDFEDEDGLQNYQGLSDNPLYSAKYWTFEDNVDRVFGNINLTYKPLSWLSFNYRIGTDFYNDFREEIAPGPRSPEDEFPVSSLGYIEHTRIANRTINSNFYTELNHNLTSKLSSTLRVGTELFQTDLNSMVNTGSEFDIPLFYQFSNTKQLSTVQYLERRRLVGLYGDLMLSYDNFLYLNVTGRNDWTSTLEKGNNSFFYPSVNLSFIFNEKLNLPDVISYGKLRASYAELGKDTEPYRTSTVYTKGLGFPVNGVLGYSRDNQRGSPDLTPERTRTIEFGTEMRFVDNRIGFEFSWYKSNTKDQIFAVPVSETTGYPEIFTNVGEMENKGIEVIVSGTPVRTSALRWDVLVNFTRNRNKVVDIAEGFDEFPIAEQFGYSGSTVTVKLKEGDAYGNIYGTSYQRYYPNGEVPDNLKYLDYDRPLIIGANGFPVRNTQQLILGNVQPKWLGGIRNSLSYKGLTFSFLIDVRWDMDQYDQFHNFLSAFGKLDYSENRNDVVVFDGVLADGTPNTKEVFLGQGVGPDAVDYGQGFYRVYYRTTSENFVRNAAFVKLRNVSLSYALPSSILSKTPFKAASVSASVNNIILWTPWINFDPESFSGGASTNATGLTSLGYPGTTSTLFSLNLTL